MRKLKFALPLCLMSAALSLAVSACDEDTAVAKLPDAGALCEPGAILPCEGCEGVSQICADDGASWSACACDEVDGGEADSGEGGGGGVGGGGE
ncbi:hypothetical protein KKF91_00280, partial [Myxococcota bacterium]|nr:hypothetical protein [Myxococcota bacterium]MBU1899443.1 hypothetical protein [Myxococcota bacterium]